MDHPRHAIPSALHAIATQGERAAVETVESFGRELQSLPVGSALPAIVLVLLGVALLVFGRHLLRPVLVIAALVGGATLGGAVLGGLLPRLDGLALALLGAALAVVGAALAWRVLFGVATGLVTGFALALTALVLVEAGAVDARAPDDLPPSTAGSLVDADVDRDAMLARTPAAIRPLVAWSHDQWASEEPQVRTLVGSAALAGIFVGFVLGLWLADAAAAALTSLTGALLVLLGGFPSLAALAGRPPGSVSPAAWLMLWIALAAGGWLVQSRRPRATAGNGEADRRLRLNARR
jgi:hypothetical protein